MMILQDNEKGERKKVSVSRETETCPALGGVVFFIQIMTYT